MKNENGSILVVSVGAILIFTILGLGSVKMAASQNQMAEEQRASTQAFWLAEAGLEKGRYFLLKSPSVFISESDLPQNMGNGTYDVSSGNDPDCPTCIDRWFIRSLGSVLTGQQISAAQINNKRTIEAIIARYDIKNAITSHGTINDDCTANGSATITGTCEQNAEFTFEGVFNGTSAADFLSEAQADGLYYLDPNNSGDVDPISDITWVDLIVKNKLVINTDNMELDLVADPSGNTVKAAILIVDTTQVQSMQPPQVHIDGNLVFRGIIWIIGEAEIKGTSDIMGAVFVDGDPVLDTKVTGDADITFDPIAVDETIDGFGLSIFPGEPAIVSWNEL